MEYKEITVPGLELMTDINQIINACKTEALKLHHHLPLAITRSIAQHNWTVPSDAPVVVKHGWLYLEAIHFNHITFKEKINKFKVKIFS